MKIPSLDNAVALEIPTCKNNYCIIEAACYGVVNG